MRVGFIGLGLMGKNMALQFVKAGRPITVYDIDAAKVDELVKQGAQSAAALQEMAELADVVITMLPMSPFYGALEDVIFHEGGLLSSFKAGSILVDMGSTSPAMTNRIANACQDKGIAFLSAPVSGGIQKAAEGKLTIYAAGPETVFSKVKPVIEQMGSVTYLGEETAKAQITKALNNALVNANLAALSEVLIIAGKAGIDVETFVSAARHGAASSYVLEVYGTALAEKLNGRASETDAEYARKKLFHPRDHNVEWSIELGMEHDIPLPVIGAVWNAFKMARKAGHVGHFDSLVDFMTTIADR